MAKTGHRSSDGVRNCKQISSEQLEELSNVVQGSSSKKIMRYLQAGNIFCYY